jgi:pimeloyl-ACP methyl ester carboxylesterase
MKIRTRICLLALATLLLPILAACRSEPVITPLVQPIVQVSPPMQAVECPFDPPPELNITCGVIQVPAETTSAIKEDVDLQIIILKSPNATAEPVFYLTGSSGSFGNLEGGASQTILRLQENRDVILFTRLDLMVAMGAAEQDEPACPEVEEQQLQVLQKLQPQAELDAQLLDAYQACRERLTAAGENLAPPNPADTVNDLLAVRSALGLQQVNLVVSGFNTLAALQLMQSDPSALRSVVVVQFSPPRAAADLQKSLALSLQRLFRLCEADDTCNAAYPNLETKLDEALKLLNSAPLTVEVRNPDTPTYIKYVVDASALAFILRDMLNSGNSLGDIPMTIDDLYSGQGFKLASELQGRLFFSSMQRQGLNLVDTCAHRWTSKAMNIPASAALHPLLQQALQADFDRFARICSLWNQQEFEPPEALAVTSVLPVLVLHGGLDPYYAPELVEEYLRGFNQSQLVVFPALSSNVFLGGDCSSSIVLSFLEDPTHQVDSLCAETQVIEFEYPPK